MTAPCELGKLGHQCQVREARGYAGGRCRTARKGFTLQELGGEARVAGLSNPGWPIGIEVVAAKK